MRRKGAGVGGSPSRPLRLVLVHHGFAVAVAFSAAVERQHDAQRSREETQGPDVVIDHDVLPTREGGKVLSKQKWERGGGEEQELVVLFDFFVFLIYSGQSSFSSSDRLGGTCCHLTTKC